MFKRRNLDGTFTGVSFASPSLHIGLMRLDPWNEFIESRVDAESLLTFKSDINRHDANMDMIKQVSDQLTVIAGPGRAAVVSAEVKLPTEGVVGFLFDHSVVPVEPLVVEEHPVVVDEAIVKDEVVLPVVVADDVVSGSIWSRLSTAVSDIQHGLLNPNLPSAWFKSNEMALVVPTDALVRGVLGSVYGGSRSLVRLSIRVIEAADVPVADIWGTSDPYVCVSLVRGVGGLSAGRLELLPTIGAVKSCTPKFATLNPKWNEVIQLDDADLLSVISDSVLHVSLWDKDIIKSDDSIGYSVVSLVDVLQVSGVSPFPLLPIQQTGSIISPHAGIFVKIHLRMVQKVGCVSITPIAVQGFTNGWSGYSVRFDFKVTNSDPIAQSVYQVNGLSPPECTIPAIVNNTGHAVWPTNTQSSTILFSSPKKSKPYLHITVKSNSNTDPGQVAVRIGMLEKLNGILPLKLTPMDGSVGADVLGKCSLYCAFDAELQA